MKLVLPNNTQVSDQGSNPRTNPWLVVRRSDDWVKQKSMCVSYAILLICIIILFYFNPNNYEIPSGSNLPKTTSRYFGAVKNDKTDCSSGADGAMGRENRRSTWEEESQVASVDGRVQIAGVEDVEPPYGGWQSGLCLTVTVESLQHIWPCRNGKKTGYHRHLSASRERESSDVQRYQFLARTDHLG